MSLIDRAIANCEACGCEDCKTLAQQLFETQHNAQRYFAVRELNAGMQGKPRDADFYEKFDQHADALVVSFQQQVKQ